MEIRLRRQSGGMIMQPLMKMRFLFQWRISSIDIVNIVNNFFELFPNPKKHDTKEKTKREYIHITKKINYKSKRGRKL